MDRFAAIELFEQIAEVSSLTKALRVSTCRSHNRYLFALAEHLGGARLVQRTKRKLYLTDAG